MGLIAKGGYLVQHAMHRTGNFFIEEKDWLDFDALRVFPDVGSVEYRVRHGNAPAAEAPAAEAPAPTDAFEQFSDLVHAKEKEIRDAAFAAEAPAPSRAEVCADFAFSRGNAWRYCDAENARASLAKAARGALLVEYRPRIVNSDWSTIDEPDRFFEVRPPHTLKELDFRVRLRDGANAADPDGWEYGDASFARSVLDHAPAAHIEMQRQRTDVADVPWTPLHDPRYYFERCEAIGVNLGDVRYRLRPARVTPAVPAIVDQAPSIEDAPYIWRGCGRGFARKRALEPLYFVQYRRRGTDVWYNVDGHSASSPLWDDESCEFQFMASPPCTDPAPAAPEAPADPTEPNDVVDSGTLANVWYRCNAAIARVRAADPYYYVQFRRSGEREWSTVRGNDALSEVFSAPGYEFQTMRLSADPAQPLAPAQEPTRISAKALAQAYGAPLPKARWSLMPWRALRCVAALMTKAAAKHGDRGYEKRDDCIDLDAALRHITCVQVGENVIDAELEQHHYACAAARLLMIVERAEQR